MAKAKDFKLSLRTVQGYGLTSLDRVERARDLVCEEFPKRSEVE